MTCSRGLATTATFVKFSNGYLVSGSDEMPFEPWALMINGVGWDLFVNVKCARRPLQRISYGGDIGDRQCVE